MRNFLLVDVIALKNKPKPICKLINQLYSQNPSYHPHDKIALDASCADTSPGIQIVEVLKSVKLPPKEVKGEIKKLMIDYVKPVDLPSSCVTAPMIQLILVNQKTIPSSVVFNVCRLGAAGLVSSNSMFWVNLYLQLYAQSLNNEPILDRNSASAIVRACSDWFIEQIEGRFIPGTNETELLESKLAEIEGYPHCWLPLAGRTITTGDLVVARLPDFTEYTLDGPAILNGRCGTCMNVEGAARFISGEVYYTITAKPDVPPLRAITELTLDAASLSKAGRKRKHKQHK